MAFHEGLSRTQRILLAIICFPLLPFYMCYVCCSASGDEDEKDSSESRGHELVTTRTQEDGHPGRDHSDQDRKASTKNEERQEEAVKNDAKGKAEVVTVEIHPKGSARRLPLKLSVGKGKKDRRDVIAYENEGFVDDNKAELSQKTKYERQEEAVKNDAKGKAEVVTVEIHPKGSARRLPLKLSVGKGKKDRRDVIAYENEGFVDDNKAELSQKTKYAYPWDKSSLKSMHIDLDKFKNLDAYASKVKPRDNMEALVQELLKGAESDLEKLRAIWMWITHHIAYDVEGLRNPNLRSGSPNDVLRTGKGVCGGYAGLFQAMCSIAGIECKEVSGYSKGGSYQPGKRFKGDSSHAWNAVRMGGRWHLLDSTWGAGNTGENSSKFKFQYDEFYFLTHPALFAGDHFPMDAKWQMLSPQLSLTQFENAHHKRSSFYNLGLLSSHPGTSLIQSDGKTTITIQSSSPVLFLHDLNGNKSRGILTLRPDGMKLDVYPEKAGQHALKVYAKASDGEEETKYSLVCEYELHCKAVSREMKLPTDLINPVGPSWLTERKGLREASQLDPIVHTADGRCSFRFRVEARLDLMAMLTTTAFAMTDDQQRRHTFLSRQGDRVEFKVQVPRAGLYTFSVYAKDKSKVGSYGFVCNYLLSCTDPRAGWPLYPLAYASWKEDYNLVEPLAGVLPANRTVNFKMWIPDVSQVSVGGKCTRDLSLDADGYWSGCCSTAGCMDLNVMVMDNPGDRSLSFILNYKVESHD